MLRDLLQEGLFCCPACRRDDEDGYHESPLRLGEVFAEEDGWIVHGFLACTGCAARYPIIDAVPILVSDPGAYLATMEDAVLWRRDLPPEIMEVVWSRHEEDSMPGWRRQMIAIYGSSLAPLPEAPDEFQEGMRERAHRSREFLAAKQAEALAGREAPLVLDAGCGVGASSLTLAGQGARVVALDQDFGALSVLSRLLREGRATLPAWRHGGGDYVPVDIAAPGGVGSADVLPVAADALAPPFTGSRFDAVVCYNLVDNVSRPVWLLRQLHALLRMGGRLLVTTPYDWAARCTAPEERLGGACPDGEADPATLVRRLLEGRLPEAAPEVRFTIREERDSLPWVIRRHERSYHVFLCHFVAADKTGPS